MKVYKRIHKSKFRFMDQEEIHVNNYANIKMKARVIHNIEMILLTADFSWILILIQNIFRIVIYFKYCKFCMVQIRNPFDWNLYNLKVKRKATTPKRLFHCEAYVYHFHHTSFLKYIQVIIDFCFPISSILHSQFSNVECFLFKLLLKFSVSIFRQNSFQF